jgi:hypothetical protein
MHCVVVVVVVELNVTANCAIILSVAQKCLHDKFMFPTTMHILRSVL